SVLFVLAAPARPAGQPEPVVTPFGRSQGSEGENVVRIDVLAVAESLEDAAAGELLRRIAEHRPVGDLAGGRAAGPDAVDDAAGAGGREPVEVRRLGDFVRGAAPERAVRAVGETVE